MISEIEIKIKRVIIKNLRKKILILFPIGTSKIQKAVKQLIHSLIVSISRVFHCTVYYAGISKTKILTHSQMGWR